MRHSAYLSKLEIFVKVVETGCLSQAGRELNLEIKSLQNLRTPAAYYVVFYGLLLVASPPLKVI